MLATVLSQLKVFDPYSILTMETIGRANHDQWFFLIRTHPNLDIAFRTTCDTIYVTRNGQELGSLYLLRQCFQLWEDEMDKWGCNGLGEELVGKW